MDLCFTQKKRQQIVPNNNKICNFTGVVLPPLPPPRCNREQLRFGSTRTALTTAAGAPGMRRGQTSVSKLTQSFVFGAALDPERRARNSLFASLISFKGIWTQFWAGPQPRDRWNTSAWKSSTCTHLAMFLPILKKMVYLGC